MLVTFEDDYRAYRDVIAAGIQALRPHVEVDTSGLDALGERIEHFDPDLVICSRLGAAEAHPGYAWVELPVDPMRPARVRLVSRYSELRNPAMNELLTVIDEMERISQG